MISRILRVAHIAKRLTPLWATRNIRRFVSATKSSAVRAREKVMWEVHPSRLRLSGPLVAILYATVLVPTARSDEPKLSISGYDPVAYFTDGKPVQGKSEFEYLWHKLRWRFADGTHRELFVKDPDRYTPQYDGYCAMGVSAGEAGHKDTVDPEAWTIDRRRQALSYSCVPKDGCLAPESRRIHQTSRRELGSCQGSG